MDKAVLVPGDSSALEVIFNSGAYSGNVTRRPAIYTITDFNVPSYHVTFTCNVNPLPDSSNLLVLSPNKIDITAADSLTWDSIPINIENRSDSAINLSLIDWPANLFEVSLPSTIAAHNTLEALVRLKTEGTLLNFSKSFTFGLSDPLGTRFTVPIKKGPPIAPAPHKYTLGSQHIMMDQRDCK